MQNKIGGKSLFLIIGTLILAVVVGISFLSSRDADTRVNLDSVTERASLMQENPLVKNSLSENASAEESTTTLPNESDTENVEVAETKPVAAVVTTPVPVPTTIPASTPVPEPEPKVVGITRAEVAMHAGESSCWTIINGGVYDITSYVPRHPGGKKQILAICGKDGTALFEGQHGGESKSERTLASFFVAQLSSS